VAAWRGWPFVGVARKATEHTKGMQRALAESGWNAGKKWKKTKNKFKLKIIKNEKKIIKS
jgi:hypothetical protein